MHQCNCWGVALASLLQWWQGILDKASALECALLGQWIKVKSNYGRFFNHCAICPLVPLNSCNQVKRTIVSPQLELAPLRIGAEVLIVLHHHHWLPPCHTVLPLRFAQGMATIGANVLCAIITKLGQHGTKPVGTCFCVQDERRQKISEGQDGGRYQEPFQLGKCLLTSRSPVGKAAFLCETMEEPG